MSAFELANLVSAANFDFHTGHSFKRQAEGSQPNAQKTDKQRCTDRDQRALH
jgi:hypothetical protein